MRSIQRVAGTGTFLGLLLMTGLLDEGFGQGSKAPPLRTDAEPLLLEPGPPPARGQEKEGFVPVDSGRLYYRASGHGPPVILIHGGYLDHRMWDGQVAPLEETHHVVRYDVRFHGRSASDAVPFSDMADLGTLMDTLGISSATIVGLSMGGQIAVDFALTHPERVEALVLVGPGLSGYPFGSPELRVYMEEITEAIGRNDFPEMIEIFTRYWCDGPHRSPEEVDPAVRSKVQEMMAASQDRWGRSPLAQPLDPPAMNRVSEIRAPTLLVLGTLDMPDIHDLVGHLESNLRGARRVDVPGVAHMVNLEAPTRFNEVLLDFLGEG
jgi:pimeloyl-ACP methyl ester carboxylesterase